jgi:intein/homing endonuclease
MVDAVVTDSDLERMSIEASYALGLWCADGYRWSSSIGLSNTNVDLILRFAGYLAGVVGAGRLKLRAYEVEGCPVDERLLELTAGNVSRCRPFKMKRTAYHLYVNSRPLLRLFEERRRCVADLPRERVGPYLAGRFDGDGTLGTPRVPGIRIVYSTRSEAEVDAQLAARVGVEEVSIYRYRRASEWCLYFRSAQSEIVKSLIAGFSSLLDADSLHSPVPRPSRD